MVTNDIKVDVTIVLAILSTTFLGEYMLPTKQFNIALGIALCISRTPAANPDKSKLYIIMNAINGPNITLHKDNIIESFKEIKYSKILTKF